MLPVPQDLRGPRPLRVDAFHEDAPWSKACRAAVHREIADLARWLEVEPLLPG